eukprot:m.510344 g.510344  ORF g.510344 m.510344 type:complete len:53 (-) comp96572_c0_seq1:10-168(-)
MKPVDARTLAIVSGATAVRYQATKTNQASKTSKQAKQQQNNNRHYSHAHTRL